MPGRRYRSGLSALALVALLLVAPARAEPPGYERDTRSHNLARGRVVFVENCLRCHESGRRGAPVYGETTDWAERLEQPLDTLIAHAIEGHGRMPARGDREISDQDVAAAVAFVVNRTRVIAAGEDAPLPAPTADAAGEPAATPDRAVVQMFLLLVGKERWK